MSAHEHKIDTSLGNLPERNARKETTNAPSIGLTDVNNIKQESIEKDTEKVSKQEESPIDKHGDTWGGGITAHHNQFK